MQLSQRFEHDNFTYMGYVSDFEYLMQGIGVSEYHWHVLLQEFEQHSFTIACIPIPIHLTVFRNDKLLRFILFYIDGGFG